MPIDPASLQAIRDPTGGRLTQIGMALSQSIQRNQQADLANKKLEMTKQLNEAKLDAVQLENADLQSKAIGAYSQSVLGALKNLPAMQAKNPQAIVEIQQQVRLSMPKGIRSIIPEQPQTIEQLKTGLENATIYQQWIADKRPTKAPTTRSVRDGDTIINQQWDAERQEWEEVGRGRYSGAKGSEFERLETKVTKGEASPSEIKRHGVLAGTEVRKGKELTEERLERKSNVEQISVLHKEYKKGSDHLQNVSNNVDAAIAAMATGDTELSDKLLAQVMSQVQDTDVRAFQMYGEFNKPFGNLWERFSGQVTRFLKGSRTEQERETIKTTLQHFKQNYAEKSLSEMRNMYRHQAVNTELDPFKVVPPTSIEDIRDYPNISRKEKIRLLGVYFPEAFKK